MIALAVLAMVHASAIDAGSWQVRSLVRGTRTAALRLACLTPGTTGWVEAIIPAELWRDCDLRGAGAAAVNAPCRGGGRLRVAGTLERERFDLMVHRTGPVGANRAAAVTLHIEGTRIGGCPPHSPNR